MNSKTFVEKIMSNLNKRHNSAQKAGRASVEFYVAIAIKAKQQQQHSLGWRSHTPCQPGGRLTKMNVFFD